jgi:hypothetical protein
LGRCLLGVVKRLKEFLEKGGVFEGGEGLV